MRLDSPNLLYDIQNAGYPDAGVLIGAISVGAVLTILTVGLFYANPRKSIVKKIRVGSILASLLSYVWLAIFYYSSYKPYHRLLQAESLGASRSVEGVIENFKPGGTERGGTVESFTVNGTPFFYSPYIFGPGFRQSNAVGGPLRGGMRVKIHYLDNCILRIEIVK